jgi:spore maturation protein CgeB
MRIAFFASSILSSYWNGAATYYRGIVKALAAQGYRITFYEPDALGRQERRDIEPPDWCEVVVYAATIEGMLEAARKTEDADVVVKASGVGIFDDELLAATMSAAPEDALRLWWDVDAPATLAGIARDETAPLRRMLPILDAVVTYGGGPGIRDQYLALGARHCAPVYNAVDPETHFPVAPDERFSADLAFLGNRLPDRERRVREFLVGPAETLPQARFLLGGAGWESVPLPSNVRALGHVSTRDHNPFNATPLAVLNINRDSMAERGYSPPTRIFEAAAAGACIITDAWEGIDTFLMPGEEILVARDGQEVVELMRALTPGRARVIGRLARARMLAEHTYAHRAVEVDALLRRLLARKRGRRAA